MGGGGVCHNFRMKMFLLVYLIALLAWLAMLIRNKFGDRKTQGNLI